MTMWEQHNGWDPSELEPEIVSSRHALITVIKGLADHGKALTVLGGHAVMEVTQGAAPVRIGAPGHSMCSSSPAVPRRAVTRSRTPVPNVHVA